MSKFKLDEKNAQKCSGGNTGTPAHSRERGWCFTSFAMDKEPVFSDEMKYLVYAPETCPDTGRPHWQGYVYYFATKSIKSSQRHLNSGKCHHEEWTMGTAEDNRTYIIGPYEKNGKFKPYNPDHKEFGVIPKQGRRTDLDELKSSILEGKKVDEIAIEKPMYFHQYGRTLDKIEDICLRKKFRTEMTTGLWIYGSTGTGKSHEAFSEYSPETHYVLINDNGWWDGYTQQDIVIINDFRGWIAYDELLQLIDKWPHKVKRRGREPMPFTSKKIIITSSLHPADVYNNRNEKDKLDQLLRRIEIKCLDLDEYEFMNDSDDF